MTAAAGRQPLSRERILRSGIALANDAGIARLSMRALAGQLHVEAMSLYNHIAGKDDLLSGMADFVVAEIDLPEAGGDWVEQMLRRARSARAAFLRYPWAPPLILSNRDPGPAMLRYVDATLGCLHAAGFSYPEADHAWNAIDSHIYGFVLLEQNFPLGPDDYQAAAAAYLPTFDRARHPHLHALGSMVAEGTHDGINDFEFGLKLLLDALERRRSGA